jgi:uncharacterized protein
MPASPAGDPILKRFRAAPDALYGDRIERVVLYGSRARGDAQVWAALRELVPRRSCAGDKARPLTGAIGELRQDPVHDVPLRAAAADLL